MNPHTFYMQKALEIAKKGRFLAPPNPWVGCLIVKNDQIIAQGFTQPPGQSHAEICALNEAQGNAQGATMYVSLEPCSHFGRTPPCADAIIRSGIKEVFIAQMDPDPCVQGRGIEILKKAGIKTHVGLCEIEAQTLLEPYLHHRKTGLPFTILKAASSLDGRTAAEDGTSQWITSLEARQDVHEQRALSQAIIIGAGTAIRDQPILTVRHPNIHLAKQPLRVILDAAGRVAPQGPLFDSLLAPTIVLTTERSSQEIRKQWAQKKAEVVVVGASEQGIDLTEAWKWLGNRGILQAFVEGGSQIQTQLLKANLIQQLSLYYGPLLLGSTGLPLFSDKIATLENAPRFKLQLVKQLNDCVRLDYKPIIPR